MTANLNPARPSPDRIIEANRPRQPDPSDYAADKIAEARALIAPLKDFTPGPWQVDAPEDESVEIATRIFAIAGLYETAPEALPDARLIAAAPALRDTVAALADLADAQAQEIARLLAALQNVMGHIDTPIARRRLGIGVDQPEWLTDARAALGEAP